MHRLKILSTKVASSIKFESRSYDHRTPAVSYGCWMDEWMDRKKRSGLSVVTWFLVLVSVVPWFITYSDGQIVTRDM